MQDAENSGKTAELLTEESARRFHEGDESEFQRIYSRFSEELHRFIQRWVMNPETVEELVQEVFVRTYRFRTAYDPRLSMRTWLRAIARNAVTDWLRANHSGKTLADSAGDAVTSVPCLKPTAEILLVRKHERKQLKRILKSLTSLQRRVLWLRAFRGLSYQEIAHELDLSLSAVKCALHRARKAVAGFEGAPTFA